MRRMILLLSLVNLAFVTPASADEQWSIVGTDTVQGNAGFIMELAITGSNTNQFFTFIEGGQHRIFANRVVPTTFWSVFPTAIYLVPADVLNIDDTWAYFEAGVFGQPTTATVKALESITVPAGTFSAYRVEMGLTSDPSTLLAQIWYSDGVGVVQQDVYDVDAPGNPLVDSIQLSSSTIVGGSGFLPIAVGNSWNYSGAVAVEDGSWGEIKALYDE